MEPILYIPRVCPGEEKLQQLITAVLSIHKTSICRSIGELDDRLKNPLCRVGMAVLYAATRTDLRQIVRLSDRLGALRVVWILPDGELEMLEEAHLIRPHVIVATESDFKYLGAILKRRIELFDLTQRAIHHC